MVDRIVTHSYRRAIERVGSVIRMSDMVERKASQTVDASRLAMIWHQREKVVGREFVVGETQSVHAELMLQEVDISQSLGLCFLKSFLSLLGRHLHKIDIDVVSGHGPVDHIFSVGQLTVGHHIRRRVVLPYIIGIGAELVLACACKFLRIIILRLGHRDIAAVILEYGHHRYILNDITGRVGSYILAGH